MSTALSLQTYWVRARCVLIEYAANENNYNLETSRQRLLLPGTDLYELCMDASCEQIVFKARLLSSARARAQTKPELASSVPQRYVRPPAAS